VDVIMAELKEVEQLRDDLKLVTKTAKVLASKLEKMSQSFEVLLASLEGRPIPKTDSTPSMASKPSPRPVAAAPSAPSPAPSPTPPPTTVSFEGARGSKASRLLEAFLGQVQTMTSGKEISTALSRLRDQVMQSADVGFHPAFHEMGRYANQIKNVRQITAAEKEALIEKVYDWKERLTG
jgi:hypothetical protein